MKLIFSLSKITFGIVDKLLTFSSHFIPLLLLLLPVIYTQDIMAADYYEKVIGTKHNFGIERKDTCIICHTIKLGNAPESSLSGTTLTAPSGEIISQKPIWGGNGKDGSKSFSIKAPMQEFGSSISCLSCHETISKHHAGPGKGQAATANDGLNHPVGTKYPRLPNGAFISKTPLKRYARYWSVPDKTTEGMTIPSGPTSNYLQIPADADANDPLVVTRLVRTTYGKVECDSCHDPHTNTYPPFLRAKPTTICLVCHDR